MTPTQRSELVARLRHLAGPPNHTHRAKVNSALAEAADALDSDALTISDLREALRPFVQADGTSPSVADLRRARAVLERTESGK